MTQNLISGPTGTPSGNRRNRDTNAIANLVQENDTLGQFPSDFDLALRYLESHQDDLQRIVAEMSTQLREKLVVALLITMRVYRQGAQDAINALTDLASNVHPTPANNPTPPNTPPAAADTQLSDAPNLNAGVTVARPANSRARVGQGHLSSEESPSRLDGDIRASNPTQSAATDSGPTFRCVPHLCGCSTDELHTVKDRYEDKCQEFIVIQSKNPKHAPITCLSGGTGTGKTSADRRMLYVSAEEDVKYAFTVHAKKDSDLHNFERPITVIFAKGKLGTEDKFKARLSKPQITGPVLAECERNLRQNLISSTLTLIGAMKKFKIDFANQATEDKAQDILNELENNKDGEVVPTTVGEKIKALWADPGVQQCYKRCIDRKLISSCAYEMDAVERITDPKYKPSEEDIRIYHAFRQDCLRQDTPQKANTRNSDEGSSSEEQSGGSAEVKNNSTTTRWTALVDTDKVREHLRIEFTKKDTKKVTKKVTKVPILVRIEAIGEDFHYKSTGDWLAVGQTNNVKKQREPQDTCANGMAYVDRPASERQS